MSTPGPALTSCRPPRRHRARVDPAFPEAAAAEARGDAATALAVLGRAGEGAPGSTRPCVASLQQLVALGHLLPGWVSSRWVLAQALQSRHRDVAARRTLAAQVAVDLRVPGEEWVCRQLFLYELGGLEHFVAHVASLELLARADSIDAWTGAAMGGFRLVGSTPRETTWRDVGTGARHLTDTIGSAVVVRPGEHVLGRLVPTGGRMMLESSPLPVDAVTAWRVAVRPEDWLEALRAAAEAVPAGPSVAYAGWSGLVHDVPPALWLAHLDEAAGTGLVEAVLDLGRQLLDGRVAEGDDRWVALMAAVLEPRVHAALAAADRRTHDVLARLLDRLADRLADPAAAVCRDLAGSRPGAAVSA